MLGLPGSDFRVPAAVPYGSAVLVPGICSWQECWRANRAEELQGNIMQEQSGVFFLRISFKIYITVKMYEIICI